MENKIHFIADCPLYAHAGDTFLPNTYTIPEDQFKYVFITECSENLEKITAFIINSEKRRDETMYTPYSNVKYL